MYQRILVATDGSPLARKAEQAAIGLAAATGGQLVALHVVPDFTLDAFEGGVANVPTRDIGRTEVASHAVGQRTVDAVVERALRAGVPAQAAVLRNDHVADAIIAAARKHKCDLIVMASHGHTGIRRLLLGSQTQDVLLRSRVPVLVLR